ncbi:hypothetical protein JZ751_004143 [Albula glossodonta]|uniref:Uncharacterized protein n=1 Tax=Albula glossodonta TaxID=121402 RepID=A0A8T2P3U3_9TELE|nr:hypothetical protein JZ751_004143 [Albula glossodonta]
MTDITASRYGAMPERLYVLQSGKVIFKGKRGPWGYDPLEKKAGLVCSMTQRLQCRLTKRSASTDTSQSCTLSSCRSKQLAATTCSPRPVEAVERQELQPGIRHQRALPDVQRLELGAALGQVLQAVVRQALAAAGVEVAQPAAVLGHVAHAHVGDAAAVRHAKVAEVALQLGDLPQAEVADEAAVADAQLTHGRAVDDQVAQGLVGQPHTPPQVQVSQLGAVRRDGVQALILQRKAVRHVQVTDRDLLAVHRRELDRHLPRQADAGHLGAAWEGRGVEVHNSRPATSSLRSSGQHWATVCRPRSVSLRQPLTTTVSSIRHTLGVSWHSRRVSTRRERSTFSRSPVSRMVGEDLQEGVVREEVNERLLVLSGVGLSLGVGQGAWRGVHHGYGFSGNRGGGSGGAPPIDHRW